MPFSHIDLLLTFVAIAVLFQFAWFSVMLLRRGVSPVNISSSLPPVLSIWVILWPVYDEPMTIWAGIMILGIPILLSYMSRIPFWLQLRIAWSGEAFSEEKHPKLPQMWSLVSFLIALAIAAAYFQRSPEVGFGLALSACIAFPVASLLDRAAIVRLGFPLHPEQTLVGHLALIIAVAILCSWSIRLYHGFDWQPLIIATLIGGLIASLIRSLIPKTMMQPLAILAIGATLRVL